MNHPLYLDNAATTPLAPQALAAAMEWLNGPPANPSSLYGLGQSARDALGQARRQLAALAGAPPQGVIFTSGGTESDNLALRGVFGSPRHKGDTLLISALEHPAVAQTAQALEKQGAKVVTLPLDGQGVVSLEALEAQLNPGVRLVSIMAVSNELGTLQPLEEAARLIRRLAPKAVFHCDAVQGFAKLPVAWAKTGVDLLSISGHKLHGPKGAGALIRFKPVALEPQNSGGGQEDGLRSGTENLFGAVAMAAAAQWTAQRFAAQRQELAQYHQSWLDELARYPRLKVYQSPAQMDWLIRFCLEGVPGEVILHHLEEQGLLVSTGSACSSRKPTPNPALLAAGFTPAQALSAIRLSFSVHNRLEELPQAFAALERAMEKLNRL